MKAASRLLAAHDGEAGAFFVNDMVLVELIRVLGRLYGFEAGECLTDTMIALKNAAAVCEYTATFDKAMRSLPGVRLL